jgi:CheY-like chemotaxis protein
MNSPSPSSHLSHLPIQNKSHLILAIEDSSEDYEALQRALRPVRERVQLERCETGTEALAYLDRCLQTTNGTRAKPLPSLILLDLNLPGIDGLGVLQSIRQHPDLKIIPTIILTTSNNPKDVRDCYRMGCNSYLIKAIEFQVFKQEIGILIHYWLDTVILPPTIG